MNSMRLSTLLAAIGAYRIADTLNDNKQTIFDFDDIRIEDGQVHAQEYTLPEERSLYVDVTHQKGVPTFLNVYQGTMDQVFVDAESIPNETLDKLADGNYFTSNRNHRYIIRDSRRVQNQVDLPAGTFTFLLGVPNLQSRKFSTIEENSYIK